MNPHMDIFQKLNLFLTTPHPRLKLGDDSLMNTKYSGQTPPDFISAIVENLQISEKPKKKSNKPPRRPKKPTKAVDNSKTHDAEQSEVEYNMSGLSLPVKRTHACPCCNWIFPDLYTEDELNQHVDMCLDGEGTKDIENYRNTIREKRKKNREKKRKIKTPVKKVEMPTEVTMSSTYTNEEPADISERCPSCQLCLGKLSPDFVSTHLKQCISEQSVVIVNKDFQVNKFQQSRFSQ